MIEWLRETLSNQCGISPRTKILLGVSGGVDSMALLHLLVEAGYQVVVAHLDHGLREGSASERELVKVETQRLGLKFFSDQVDTEAFAQDLKLSLEEAAREVRYDFLFRVAEDNQCQAVAVAHHANDQAETILLHLVRGTGLNGLAGMAYRSLTKWHLQIPLVRPLLDVSREALEAYCQKQNLTTLEDESNEDVRFLRNKIRLELLPIMEELNPRLVERLGRMGMVVGDELSLLDKLTEVEWAKIHVESPVDEVRFSRAAYIEYGAALGRRLMRKALGVLMPGLVNVGFDLIERAVTAVADPPKSGELDLMQGLRLSIQDEEVRIWAWDAVEDLSEFPQLVFEIRIDVGKSSVIELGDGWALTLTVDPAEGFTEILQNPDGYTAFLDLGNGSGPLTIRTRRDGDRIAPLGMGGSEMKVSDLMINEGILRAARERWPIIEFGGEIVWVPGCRSGENARVVPESTIVVKLVLKRSG